MNIYIYTYVKKIICLFVDVPLKSNEDVRFKKRSSLVVLSDLI